jgi:hypothetical protein
VGLIDRLFGRSSQGGATPPKEFDAFCALIAREGAWLVAGDVSEQRVTFLDYVDAHGQHMWPLFSTQDTATAWVRHSAKGARAFPCLQLTPEALLDTVPVSAKVIFDAKSPFERVLSDDQLQMLKRRIATSRADT